MTKASAAKVIAASILSAGGVAAAELCPFVAVLAVVAAAVGGPAGQCVQQPMGLPQHPRVVRGTDNVAPIIVVVDRRMNYS